MRKIAALVAAACLCVALAVPASAGVAVERPYMGTQVGTSTIVEGDCVPVGPTLVCPFSTVGTAHVTHLGRSTVTSEGSLTLSFIGTCTLLDGETPGLPYTTVGTSEFVAANGDSLLVELELDGCLGAQGTEGIGTPIVGSQTVTGGTGRFAGATGSGTTSGTGLGDVFDVTTTGTITY